MAHTSSIDRLKVFISSKMIELRDVRELVGRALEDRGIHAWVYEEQAGARPETAEETSLDNVEDADIYIGLFGVRYGAVTVQEYHRARELNKPCLIYIRDKGVQREKELEDFLQTEVYDLQRGVTYEYFAGAFELAAQAAENIMAWLVRRHREMTAELCQAYTSQIEVTRLQAEVDRLQAASLERLPQGTAADYLAKQMRGWFETLGYRFERYGCRTKDYFEWIITVPARRGRHRILVRGIEGEIEISDVTALRQVADVQKTDEGWLVAAYRVSQAARDETAKHQQRNLFCYTFDELLDEQADFGGYLAWLEAEVKRRGIDRMYVPLACIKEELDPSTREKVGESRYDERNGYADNYLDRWLEDPAKEHISILGEFGMGKTWFALHYAWTVLQRYRNAKLRGLARPRLPLYIPLRDYAKAISVESLFSEFFFRKHEIPLPGYSVFEQLNRMGKLLLIFDGFDEMATKVDRQKVINNFWELARVVVPGTKVILTSRAEHFPDAREGRALLSAEVQVSTNQLSWESPQFEVIELTEFTDAQIRQVVAFRAGNSAVQRVMDNPQLLDLARRPIMAEFILEALPDIESGGIIDLSRVYFYAARRKMERDIKSERTFTSLADKLYFLCELSWEMLATDQLSLNYRAFPDRLRRLFGRVVQEQKDLDHWHYDMMSQTMLIRNADGDYTPAHRSLLEFFVAYKFAAELGLLSEDLVTATRAQSHLDSDAAPEDYRWSAYFRRQVDERGEVIRIAPLRGFIQEDVTVLAQTIGKQPLTKAISLLLYNMLDAGRASADGLENMRRGLWGIVLSQKGRTFEEASYLPGNIITILRLLGDDFADRDFSRLCLAGADFEGDDLTGANFTESLLLNCNFSNCNLTGANFTDAEFKEASWGESGAVYSLDISPDDRHLATSVQGRGLELWDLDVGNVIADLPIPDTVYVTRFSRDGNYVAAATRSGQVIVYDLELQKIRRHDLSKHYKIENLCFGHDSNVLIFGVGQALHIFDLESHSFKILKVEVTADIRSLVYHYQSKVLLVASANGVLSVRSGPTYAPIVTRHIHQSSIRALDMNAAGDLAASGGKDGQVALTEIPSGVLRSFTNLPGSVFSVAFHPAADHLAASIHGQQVVILKVPELSVLHTLGAHSENVRELRYSRSGTSLLTASYDGCVNIWSVPSYEVIGTLRSGGSGKTRICCHGTRLGGAKGLTDEYISFFKERGALI
jgi:WD40 repeat protein